MLCHFWGWVTLSKSHPTGLHDSVLSNKKNYIRITYWLLRFFCETKRKTSVTWSEEYKCPIAVLCVDNLWYEGIVNVKSIVLFRPVQVPACSSSWIKPKGHEPGTFCPYLSAWFWHKAGMAWTMGRKGRGGADRSQSLGTADPSHPTVLVQSILEKLWVH